MISLQERSFHGRLAIAETSLEASRLRHGTFAERRTLLKMASKVFVGNLNFNTTREELETLFGQAGAITDVYLPTDRDTGRPRGFAFVTFGDEAAAKDAITRFNGHELGGRQLRVNEAEDRRRPSAGGGPRFSGGPGGGGYGGGYEGGGDRDGGYGGDRGGFGGGKPKGSRRNIRAKKRAL
jgi:RNA recognition motif-containing protein